MHRIKISLAASRVTEPGPPNASPDKEFDAPIHSHQLSGTVTEVNVGSVMATVKVRLTGSEQVVTASITKEAVQELGLEPGTSTTVLIKSTEVMLAVD